MRSRTCQWGQIIISKKVLQALSKCLLGTLAISLDLNFWPLWEVEQSLIFETKRWRWIEIYWPLSHDINASTLTRTSLWNVFFMVHHRNSSSRTTGLRLTWEISRALLLGTGKNFSTRLKLRPKTDQSLVKRKNQKGDPRFGRKF